MDFIFGFFEMFSWIGTGHVILFCWIILMGVILVNWQLAQTRKAGEKLGFAGLVRSVVRGPGGRRNGHSDNPLRRSGR